MREANELLWMIKDARDDAEQELKKIMDKRKARDEAKLKAGK